MSIKAIREEIAKLVEEKDTLCSIKNTEVRQLETKIRTLQDKLYAAKRKAFEEVRPRIEELRQKILLLEKELETHKEKSQRFPPVDNKLIPEHFFKTMRGYEGGSNWKVLWISPQSKYLIVKIPGGNFWSGRGETSYAMTSCGVYDAKGDFLHPEIEFLGVLTKARMELLKNKALELEKGNV